ncbi:MAG: hypothetical protein COZ70_15795 [Deltaproteobacteria bacterium CG_4_8_14_3_um_filter_51_11]|nr:MAG: hypothetical protein COX16_13735 [Deltaproteobacteria bacterium CG23_combo_of_CG06-09_8_20_14_all_51_20]PIX18128.1 MAG: hypothetical protein COZ70_15795 [Deltaproteobacteria bacterium CG_4_8_14_3_um_filter_51_11]PJB36991.1 MAG: hypothetical protein CO107_06135 [Deltaproteobacteria bacterium CG_4_9_14_3_um_filter_51_14]
MMKQNLPTNYCRYLHILIFSSVLLSHTALASEPRTLKWSLDSQTQCIMAADDFTFSVSKQRLIIRKENRVVLDHDFKRPIIYAVLNPLLDEAATRR